MSPLRWVRMRIAEHRLRGAHLDLLYWQEETERCRANIGVAYSNIEAARDRLNALRWPLNHSRRALRDAARIIQRAKRATQQSAS